MNSVKVRTRIDSILKDLNLIWGEIEKDVDDNLSLASESDKINEITTILVGISLLDEEDFQNDGDDISSIVEACSKYCIFIKERLKK